MCRGCLCREVWAQCKTHRVAQEKTAQVDPWTGAKWGAKASLCLPDGLLKALTECQLHAAPSLKDLGMLAEEGCLPEEAGRALLPDEGNDAPEVAAALDLQPQVVGCRIVHIFHTLEPPELLIGLHVTEAFAKSRFR